MGVYTFAVKAQGWNHIILNRVCQDSVKKFSSDKYSIVAVADGHGASPYFRSDIGSHYAVNSAVKNLKRFMKKTIESKIISPAKYAEFIAGIGDSQKRLKIMYDLFGSIHNDWVKSVNADLDKNPFKYSEYSELPPECIDAYTSNNKNYHRMAYGSTMLTALICDDFWLALQIGDGNCVSIYPDGTIKEDIPADDDFEFSRNYTHSMCNFDAMERFKYYISTEKPRSVFLSTDGVLNSFEYTLNHYQLYNFLRDIEDNMQANGVDKASRKTKNIIYDLSEENCGDDVSLAGILIF